MGWVCHQLHPIVLETSVEDIPVGARFQDPEVAAKLAADTAAGSSCMQHNYGTIDSRRHCNHVWSIPYAKSSIWRKSSSPK